MTEPTDPVDAPSRIEWLELFFDLVVVAAVAVLSEAPRVDTTWPGRGIFLVTYDAVWFAWISVVLCADAAAELTRMRTVVVSMLLPAVMAAVAPGHHANAFAFAFLLVRLFAARLAAHRPADDLLAPLLVLLWLLTFAYGYAGAPGVRLGQLPPRAGLPLHLASTGILHNGLADPLLIWLLTLPVAWQFLYAQRHNALLRIGKRTTADS